MQYKLAIRKIIESDLSVNRPFMPEDENYEMYLSALVEDIENIECVTELLQNGNDLVITIENESEFNQLHTGVKYLLNNSYNDKLVVDSGFTKVV